MVQLKSTDSLNLNGAIDSTSATANTIAKRDSSGDISARLVRSNYTDESSMSGAIAFRKSTSDNYIRFCNSPTAVRTWLGVSTGENLSFKGDAACESGSTRPADSGLIVKGAYNSTGYPESYGNVISVKGRGDNQLFLG